MHEKSPEEIWEMIGTLEEVDVMPVLTSLFAIYENRLEQDPDNYEAHCFFRNLSQVLSRISACNLNRR